MVLKGILFSEKALCPNCACRSGSISVHRTWCWRKLGRGENRPICLSVEYRYYRDGRGRGPARIKNRVSGDVWLFCSKQLKVVDKTGHYNLTTIYDRYFYTYCECFIPYKIRTSISYWIYLFLFPGLSRWQGRNKLYVDFTDDLVWVVLVSWS